MRILLVGVAAVALSGCSWLGLGGNHNYNSNYDSHTGYYHAQQPVKHDSCKSNQCLSRWNIEAAVGPEFIVGGKAITGDQINANDQDFVVNNVKMRDAFDDGYRAELGGSYALNPNRKITATGFYAEANGAQNVQLATSPAGEIRGDFSDYTSYGAEIGLRQYMHPRKGLLLNSVRPYVEGKLGGAYVEDISVTNSNGTAPSRPLYDGGWVPTAAGMVGFETPVLPQMTLGLESGLRYTGKLDSDNSFLQPGNLAAGSNNGSDRWTVPVMLRGRYRF